MSLVLTLYVTNTTLGVKYPFLETRANLTSQESTPSFTEAISTTPKQVFTISGQDTMTPRLADLSMLMSHTYLMLPKAPWDTIYLHIVTMIQ